MPPLMSGDLSLRYLLFSDTVELAAGLPAASFHKESLRRRVQTNGTGGQECRMAGLRTSGPTRHGDLGGRR